MELDQRRSAVVLSIDGLGARYLGPYGNTSMTTPGFNRLASRSMLFETALARVAGGEGPDAWGWDRLGNEAIQQAANGNPGARSILVTDSTTVGDWGADRFDEVIEIPTNETIAAASEVAETRLARFFAEAIERILQLDEGELLVLHTSGLLFPWDAPYEFREALQGEDDPPPPRELSFETGRFQEIDPDELLGWQQAYGAQIAALDHCIELFCDVMARLAIQPLVCVCSPQAFPIGEHGFLGTHPECLYDDALHVPMFIYNPTIGAVSSRVSSLTYADHWTTCVNEWMLGKELPRPEILPRKEFEWLTCTSANSSNAKALRTHAWKFLFQPPRPHELFAKPDDRWEKNDVADRCHEVVELLEKSMGNASVALPEVLPSLLCDGVI
jgi:hypothetical protein